LELLLLHRALANAGDFLIFERARRLIAAVYPDAILHRADAWRPLADQLSADELRRFRAIVICGGPGYAVHMRRLYPLGDLGSLPPVVPLALGSNISPGTRSQIDSFRFDAETRAFLGAILERAPQLGARDHLTRGMLIANGLAPVLMTGDPAWYHLDQIDEPIRRPSIFRSIAFTPPANPAYAAQASRLFRAVAKAFPGVRPLVVFHRGIQPAFARQAEQNGWQIVDIGGSVDGFSLYDDVDLHVGYRVHAHLYSTSIGTVSYLVAEDSRGIGAIQALGGLGAPGFDASDPVLRATAIRTLGRASGRYPRLAGAVGAYGRALGLPEVAASLPGAIGADQRAGFPAHVAARDTIRATLPEMYRMIRDIP
jgi:hypothetical protein